mmetsp:Transcript_30628/g.49884  ORF Transcript_30628/g.49884 Transcript_30628/m.49884 type:complete len:118 (-) Transcript_30628:1184-1537(-)
MRKKSSPRCNESLTDETPGILLYAAMKMVVALYNLHFILRLRQKQTAQIVVRLIVEVCAVINERSIEEGEEAAETYERTTTLLPLRVEVYSQDHGGHNPFAITEETDPRQGWGRRDA